MTTVVEMRSTRKQKRQAIRQGLPTEPKGLYIKHIQPLTSNQSKTFESFSKNKNLLLHGSAGTGKTFISLYLSLLEVMEGQNDFQEVIILRSVVPTRDMGFLPGSAKEKTKVYEAPYYSICNELFGRGDAYEILKTKNIVNFQSTSFVRGITFSNCIIIVDEYQNMTGHELSSLVTRLGKNCRIIFSGDTKQSDLTKYSDIEGHKHFKKIINTMNSFNSIEFTTDDIVRGNICKEFLIASEQLANLRHGV